MNSKSFNNSSLIKRLTTLPDHLEINLQEEGVVMLSEAKDITFQTVKFENFHWHKKTLKIWPQTRTHQKI